MAAQVKMTDEEREILNKAADVLDKLSGENPHDAFFYKAGDGFYSLDLEDAANKLRDL